MYSVKSRLASVPPVCVSLLHTHRAHRKSLHRAWPASSELEPETGAPFSFHLGAYNLATAKQVRHRPVPFSKMQADDSTSLCPAIVCKHLGMSASCTVARQTNVRRTGGQRRDVLPVAQYALERDPVAVVETVSPIVGSTYRGQNVIPLNQPVCGSSRGDTSRDTKAGQGRAAGGVNMGRAGSVDPVASDTGQNQTASLYEASCTAPPAYW
jgi:hypothetical protein